MSPEPILSFPLMRLPLVLRLKIYEVVLDSTTGCIVIPPSLASSTERKTERTSKDAMLTMSEVDFQNQMSNIRGAVRHKENDLGEVNISILMASKQISMECIPVLWERNSFYGDSPPILRGMIRNHGLKSYIYSNLRHVSLGVNMLRNKRLKLDWGCYKQLNKLAKSGSLKSIAFANMQKDPIERYCDPRNDNFFGNWLETMRLARDGPLAPLTRKFHLYSGLARLKEKTKQTHIRKLPKNPTEVMDKLHEAIGGELWIDDVLCYQRGVRLEELFKISVAQGEDLSKLSTWAQVAVGYIL